MSHPASKLRSNSQTRYRTTASLIPQCKLILFRWFSPVDPLISSDKDEPPRNDKQWRRFSVAEMVDDLFSENPTTSTWALKKTRQLMMNFPDRLMCSVIRMKLSPKFVNDMRIFDRNRRLKTALASVILQFEHPIAAFGSEFTPISVVQLSYPDLETIQCMFDALCHTAWIWNRENNHSFELTIIKSIAKQENPNASVVALRTLATMMMCWCLHRDLLYQDSAYQELMPALKYLLKQTDTEVLYYTASAVDSFAFRENWLRDLLMDAGILHHLIPLLSHLKGNVASVALSGVFQFTNGSSKQRQAVWDCGFLNYYPNLLTNVSKYECVWVLQCLSDLAGGNRELLCVLLDRGLFPQIANHATHENIPPMTAGDLMNYDNCKEEHSVANGFLISELCYCMNHRNFDILVTLRSLSKILSHAGDQVEYVKKQIRNCCSVEGMEILQWSVNDDESRLCYHIMEDCFG